MNAATVYPLLLNALDLTPAEFERITGLGQGAVGKAIKRNSTITKGTAELILKAFPQVNSEWLATGSPDYVLFNDNGQVQLIEGKSTPGGNDVIRNPLLRRKEEKGSEVPFYDADFAAGTEISFFEDNVERPAYTMHIPGYAGCIAFPCYGDSMENMIRSGSILFGRKLEDWRSYLEFGQIYGVVMKDQRRFLKYIRKSAEDPKKCFLLRSENPKYDDFEIPKDKIHNIWLIEGWMLKRT